jgi:hypothetical protein
MAYSPGGDLAFGAPHETRQARKTLNKIRGQATANVDERIGIGEFARGISREQRDWADLKTRPIERALSDVIRNRMNGDQTDLIGGAQRSVLDSYDRSAGSATRNAARYGITLDPSADRGFGLDRTKTSIAAGNMAAQTDRDNALQDAGQFYRNGAGLPGMATQEYIAGAGSLADQHDYGTGMKVGDALGQIKAQEGFAQAMADGGEVGGIGGRGRVLEGESERVELNSGDFIVPEQAVEFYGREFWDKLVTDNGGDISASEAGETDSAATEAGENGYADGGSVVDTARLKNKHTDEYSQGKTDKQFGPWLEDIGYELGPDNQVRTKSAPKAVATRAPDNRPRTPDFLFQPHKPSENPDGYADGGGVGFGLGEGIERGYAGSVGSAIGAVRTGLIAGLGEARNQQEHDLRMANSAEDRAYQKTQRGRQEQAYNMQMETKKAAGAFAASGGVDVTPLINLHNQRNPDSKINLAPSPDGSGSFALITTRPDGSEASKILKPEEIRTFGMGLTQSLHDPNAYFAKQETLDEKRREFDEKMKLLREGHRLSGRGTAGATEHIIDRIAREEGIPWSQAWDKYKHTAENPEKSAQSLFAEMSASRDKLWDQTDPRRPTDDALIETAIKVTRRFQNAGYPGPSSRTGKLAVPGGEPVDTKNMRRPDNGLNGSAVGPLSGLQPLEPAIQAPAAQTAAPVRQTPAAAPAGAIPQGVIDHLKKNVGVPQTFENGQVMAADGKGNIYVRGKDGKFVLVQ